jgi:sulfide dehydrogenase cytochrome subunit
LLGVLEFSAPEFGLPGMKSSHALLAGVLAYGIASTISAAAAGDPPPGATSCSGCHPVNQNVDTPVPRLIGQDPAKMVAALQGFRSGQRPATVMDRIAKGFSDDEIKSIAAWFGAQR